MNRRRRFLKTTLGFLSGAGLLFSPLYSMVKKANANDTVTHVTVRGPEGPYENLQRFPIVDILTNKVFLAYQVNGKILPQKHGFPLRAVAEDYYGFDWIKYVYKVSFDF